MLLLTLVIAALHSQPARISAPDQERICRAGVQAFYPLSPDLAPTSVASMREGSFVHVRMTFAFSVAREKKHTGIADCFFPLRGPKAEEEAARVIMTSNGVTHTLRAKELKCFSNGRFC